MADRVQELITMLVEQLANGFVADGVQIMQAAVFQFFLDIRNTQAMGDGGIHLHRFQRLITAFLLRPGITGAHIVQAVAQFDDHDADVLAHGQQHLAKVFRLAVLHVGELDLGQLGDAIHQQRYLGAEFLFDLCYRHRGVFGHIVHEGGSDAFAVHAQFHQDLRH